MGRRRGAGGRSTGTKPGPARKVVLGLVVVGAVALVIASWRSAPPSPEPAVPATAAGPARGTDPPPATAAEPKTATQPADADATPARYQPLLGQWVRPDGGYVLAVESVAEDGKAEVGYFNPRPINVARAEGRLEGDRLELFVELQDRNYPGSTYTLRYDAEARQLVGVYFQAVQRASYDVVFVRR